MANVKTKTVVVNGRDYYLYLMTPLDAVRVRNLIMTAAFRSAQDSKASASEESVEKIKQASPEEQTQGFISAVWTTASAGMKKEDYADIQIQCLLKCSLSMNGAGPIPVMMTNGRFADKELEDDPSAVDQLVVEALCFNLASFFQPRPTSAPKEG